MEMTSSLQENPQIEEAPKRTERSASQQNQAVGILLLLLFGSLVAALLVRRRIMSKKRSVHIAPKIPERPVQKQRPPPIDTFQDPPLPNQVINQYAVEHLASCGENEIPPRDDIPTPSPIRRSPMKQIREKEMGDPAASHFNLSKEDRNDVSNEKKEDAVRLPEPPAASIQEATVVQPLPVVSYGSVAAISRDVTSPGGSMYSPGGTVLANVISIRSEAMTPTPRSSLKEKNDEGSTK